MLNSSDFIFIAISSSIIIITAVFLNYIVKKIVECKFKLNKNINKDICASINITSNNQLGGTTTQNVDNVNIGHIQRKLNDSIKQEVIKITNDSYIKPSNVSKGGIKTNPKPPRPNLPPSGVNKSKCKQCKYRKYSNRKDV